LSVAVDDPHTNKLTVHILAAVAQHDVLRTGMAWRDLPELLWAIYDGQSLRHNTVCQRVGGCAGAFIACTFAPLMYVS
jgi:hypothetical protein